MKRNGKRPVPRCSAASPPHFERGAPFGRETVGGDACLAVLKSGPFVFIRKFHFLRRWIFFAFLTKAFHPGIGDVSFESVFLVLVLGMFQIAVRRAIGRMLFTGLHRLPSVSKFFTCRGGEDRGGMGCGSPPELLSFMNLMNVQDSYSGFLQYLTL